MLIEKRYIGVVGSGEFKNKDNVIFVLERTICKETDVIVSGRSPRNKQNNVDIWAEQWAIEHCKNEPKIFPANEFNRNEFFKRNKQIADLSQYLLCFIPIDLYVSGTWNTIKWFSLKENFSFDSLFIYADHYSMWKFDNYPIWLKNRNINKNKNKMF